MQFTNLWISYARFEFHESFILKYNINSVCKCISHYKIETDPLFVSKRVEEDFIKYAGKISTVG